MAAALQNEYELFPPVNDGITAMHILENRFLLVSSWDTNVRLYDLSINSQKTSYQHKAGVLDCCFQDRDRNIIYSGGIDRQLKQFDAVSGVEKVIGTHEKAIKCVDFSSFQDVVITGSWDSTVKLWDPRAATPCTGTYKQPERIYTMSLSNDKLVVGTAGRHVHIYDFRNMKEPQQRRESSLKYQTRCLRCGPDGSGYALSSIEGRVAMEYFDPAPEVQARKYAFKCHRTTTNGVDTIYPVNTIAFHQRFGTFATGGCDGLVNIWDGQNKKRLYQYRKYPTSISAMAFSADGSILAIASSYTFEEGERDHPEDQIFIRSVQESEVMPKSLQKT
jgi:cell cycle arrest protein BUB3